MTIHGDLKKSTGLSFVLFQGAFHALRPEDLWRRPNFFVSVAASIFQ